jgi:hypothetical protein
MIERSGRKLGLAGRSAKDNIKTNKFPVAALRPRSASELSDQELTLIAACGHPEQLSDTKLVKLFHDIKRIIDSRGLKID